MQIVPFAPTMKPLEYETMRTCEDRHWWYAVLRDLVCTELRRRVPVGEAVLDAGCGTGGMMARLNLWDKTGIDFSPIAIQHCRNRGLPNVRRASVNALPFADESFAAVLCLDVLYHEAVEPERASGELLRVLRPGGVLIFNHAAFETLRGTHDAAVSGKRRYRADQVHESLRRHGMAMDVMHYWNAWLFLPLMLHRRFAVSTVSDMAMPAKWFNAVLASAGRVDAWLCRALRVPFGSSLFVVAHKPRTGGSRS
jgi:SAM-dependent methyltransferase